MSSESNRSISLLELMMEISDNGTTLMDSEIQNQVDAIMLEVNIRVNLLFTIKQIYR